MVEICELDSDEREYQAEWYRRRAMMKRMLKLAATCEFDTDYELADGVFISFKCPEDDST